MSDSGPLFFAETQLYPKPWARISADGVINFDLEGCKYSAQRKQAIAMLVMHVRSAALEEAAKVCDERALGNLQLGSFAHPVAHEMLDARDAEAQCCASAIRALAIHILPTCTDSGEK